MFGQHSHHVREALIDGDVERRAHGVVQEVYIRPLAQQQPCDLCLVTEGKRATNGKTHRLLCCLCGAIPPVLSIQLVNKNSNV